MGRRGRRVSVAAAVAALTLGPGVVQSGAAPSTTAPAPAVSAAQIDSLVIPPEGLGGGLHADSWGGQPTGDTVDCADAPGGSRALFAPGSLARRDVRYTGSSNVYVIQHLGVYPSDGDARSAFAGLVDTVRDCVTDPLDADGPDRVAWHHMVFSPVSGGDVPYSTEARVIENVVLVVNTGILSPSVGTRIADAIDARIRKPL